MDCIYFLWLNEYDLYKRPQTVTNSKVNSKWLLHKELLNAKCDAPPPSYSVWKSQYLFFPFVVPSVEMVQPKFEVHWAKRLKQGAKL